MEVRDVVLLVFFVSLPIAFGVIGSALGKKFRSQPNAGWWLGFLLGPFGLFFIAFLNDRRRFCPTCHTPVGDTATVCPSCQSAIEPMIPKPRETTVTAAAAMATPPPYHGTLQYPIGYMGIGAILDVAIEVLKGRLGMLLSISAMTLIPVQLIFGFLTEVMAPGLRAGDPRMFQEHPGAILVLILGFVVTFMMLMPLVNGATIHGIASSYLSRPTSLGDCFKQGVRRWPALVGTTILMFLAIYGGMFLCFVPGIIFAFWFLLSPYVVVLENIAGPEALGRSKGLIKGEIGKGFVLGMVVGIINLAMSGIGALVPQPQVQLVIQTVVSAALSVFDSCAFTIYYFSCRSKHDNFDLLMLVQSVEQG